jgi:predicted nucleic acid-binding protein
LKSALLDSSAIVALFDRTEESHHRAVVEALKACKGAVVTVEPVIAESCHLLRKVPGAPEAILQNVARNIFEIPFRLSAAATEIERLLHKYRDQQIDLADACLIHLAGELETGNILTLDRDFEVYRWGRNRAFEMLIQRK